MKKCLLILVLNLLLAGNVLSQSVSADGFINYTVGNKWKYESRNSDKELTIEITECTETDTLTTCQVENFGKLIVQDDSVFVTDFFAEFFSPELSPAILKYYMSDFPVDSVWDACWDCTESEADGGSEGFITDTTTLNVFGEYVLTKTVVVKYGKNDPLGVPSVQLEIAEKFGIISIQYWHGDALVMTGAVIEGKSYGSLIVSNEREEEIDRAQNYSLSEPYPNPFNPDVSFELNVARAEEIKIQVYDVLGRLVISAPAKRYLIGSHQVRLDLEHVQTGVFFIVAQSPSQSKTKKITKIK